MKRLVVLGVIAVCFSAVLFIKNATAFQGRVVEVDRSSRTLAVQAGKNTVRFDAARTVFKGYNSLYGVHVGDIVSVSFIKEGLQVARISGRADTGSRADSKYRKKKDAKGFIRKMGKDPACFEDLDENKDGKISPAELSVLLPGLTMEQFKRYDKKGDGYLDEAEFEALLKELGKCK